MIRLPPPIFFLSPSSLHSPPSRPNLPFPHQRGVRLRLGALPSPPLFGGVLGGLGVVGGVTREVNRFSHGLGMKRAVTSERTTSRARSSVPMIEARALMKYPIRLGVGSRARRPRRPLRGPGLRRIGRRMRRRVGGGGAAAALRHRLARPLSFLALPASSLADLFSASWLRARTRSDASAAVAYRSWEKAPCASANSACAAAHSSRAYRGALPPSVRVHEPAPFARVPARQLGVLAPREPPPRYGDTRWSLPRRSRSPPCTLPGLMRLRRRRFRFRLIP